MLIAQKSNLQTEVWKTASNPHSFGLQTTSMLSDIDSLLLITAGFSIPGVSMFLHICLH